MALPLGKRAAWGIAVSIPLVTVAYDYIACLIPAPIINAGKTVRLVGANEWILCSRRIDLEQQEHRQSYIIFKSPHDPAGRGIAKAVGLPGDIYIPFDHESGVQTIQRLHPGQVMLQDDELDRAQHAAAGGLDSRDFGPLPTVMVEGRPIAVVWPPSAMRKLY